MCTLVRNLNSGSFSPQEREDKAKGCRVGLAIFSLNSVAFYSLMLSFNSVSLLKNSSIWVFTYEFPILHSLVYRLNTTIPLLLPHK